MLKVAALKHAHFFPFFDFEEDSALAWDSFSCRTCFTHFCSSMRKARTMRAFTQAAQRVPPYARFTRRSRFLRRRYSVGARQGMPISAFLQSPHLGPCRTFLTVWNTSLPPGVFTGRTLLPFVLYRHCLR